MTGIDIFWLFLMLSALQPILKQKMLETSRIKLMHTIEKLRKSRVILMIHRQETMSFLGFPIMRFINIDDAEEVIRAIHLTDNRIPLDIILHTPGGLVLAASQIARAIKKRKGKTTVIVPHYAMSGGTLIALAADEIIMDEHAVLGPIDPQLGQYPAASIVNVLKQKKPSEIDDETLIRADISKKAIEQMKNFVFDLLKDKFEEKKAKEIAELLSSGTWTHDFPLFADDLKKMGFNVNCNVPKEVYQLMNLYPQPVKRFPTVEYIPVPYNKKQTPENNNK